MSEKDTSEDAKYCAVTHVLALQTWKYDRSEQRALYLDAVLCRVKHGKYGIFVCPLPKNFQCLFLTYDGHSAVTFIKNQLDTSTFFLSGCKSTMIAILLLLKILTFTVTEFPLLSYYSVTLNSVKSLYNSSQLTQAPPPGFITPILIPFSSCWIDALQDSPTVKLGDLLPVTS